MEEEIINMDVFIDRVLSDNSYYEYLLSDGVTHPDIKFECNESEKDYFRRLLDLGESRKRDYAVNIILLSLLYNSDEVVNYFLTEEVLSYLISNQICLCTLAHTHLDNKWLLKIYLINQGEYEALQTVSLRYLFDESIMSIDEYNNFICTYKNKFVYFYMLYCAIEKDNLSIVTYTKAILLCTYIQNSYYKKDKLYLIAKRYEEILTKVYKTQKGMSKKFLDKEMKDGMDFLTELCHSDRYKW